MGHNSYNNLILNVSFEWVKNRKVVEDILNWDELFENINITKFFPVSNPIWKHSRNKVKTDYWVRDANLNYESKITNIARIANAVQCHN